MKKILLLANDVTTILQFRQELVRALVDNGNEVLVCVPQNERISEIEALGASVVTAQVSRHGKNPFKDLGLYKEYKKLLKEIKPDIVFSFTIKPNVYGGMACAKLKIPYVANVTGLGVVGDRGILQKLMLFLYKKGVKKASCVFFQNKSNMEFFQKKKVVRENVMLLPGSGVNVERFSYMTYPEEEKANIVFVGRIIKDKGVFELAEAAEKYKNDDRVRFTVVGDVEYGAQNPFEGMANVNCVGFHKDVRPFLQDAHAVILPSYHEGMANVLLEGAASGRVILASNIPGCEETFDEGITGFGFEPKNTESLCQAIEKLLSLPNDQRCQMGKAGREKMEQQFNRQIVVNKYLDQIKLV